MILRKIKEISTTHYYLGIAVLVVSLLCNMTTIGYGMRRIDELAEKISSLEAKGSITAQLTSKDVQWIIESIKNQTAQLTRVEVKIDRHMAAVK